MRSSTNWAADHAGEYGAERPARNRFEHPAVHTREARANASKRATGPLPPRYGVRPEVRIPPRRLT
ncbi:hypothetical protein GCM10017771_08020 [Streptomyces capitiformicae]|uniref:Uncharacterized protein n=1 Tax=Streptomyces capitiformicae TaxID=2014920 RepID=A0A919GEA5_9ACTN|nr:hypothetical protein GCM10017771_08020 [Streptomyces capitiformicae]